MCESGKKCYATPGEAAAVVESMRRHRSSRTKEAGKTYSRSLLSHYRCKHCKCWHVGHGRARKVRE